MSQSNILGDTIRRLRLEKRFDQQTLAIAIGITPASLSRLELGFHKPRMRTLGRLAIALDVTPSELLDRVTAEELL